MATEKKASPKTFERLAELHVAGLFAEAGWDVYFPHRDKGFDFVVIRKLDGKFLIRPVQVKGKYPEEKTGDRSNYGYVGKLSQDDPEMVLAIPLFERGDIPVIRHVAFMPRWKIMGNPRGYRCQPAKFKNGAAVPRRDHKKFFDREGLKALESRDWSQEGLYEVQS